MKYFGANYTNTCSDPLEFITGLKRRYKKGLPLVSPDLGGRSLLPEDLLNQEIDLGECDNPVVLALIASKDPLVTMSLAAATRLSPRAARHRLISGVFGLIGELTCYEEVKHCVQEITTYNFNPEHMHTMRSYVIDQIQQKRMYYRKCIKESLKLLIDGRIAPEKFIQDFFTGMNQLNLRSSAYAKMVLDFLLSPRFRPKVKILMIENIYRMPREVRLQIVVDLCNVPKSGHNEAVRDELICVLQEEPALLMETANKNSPNPMRYMLPFTKQRSDWYNDPAFRSAEEILA